MKVESVTNTEGRLSKAVSQTAFIAFFAVLTAAAARLEIPTIPVPFTLQTLVVLLAGAFLGKRDGFLSQILYLTMGVSGLPVFASGSAGFATLLGPTGGYLLAFPLTAFFIGWMINRRSSTTWTVFTFTAGLLGLFLLGTFYLNAVYIHNAGEAFSKGFLIFSVWDGVKIAAATAIFRSARRS